jgi:hypothetical protein
VVTSIRNGTHYGESLLYSDEEVELTPGQARYRARSRFPDPVHPDLDVPEPLPPGEWEEIERLAGLWTPHALPAVVGMPDASDAGAEFVEVSEGTQRRRVEFDVLVVPPEIAALVERLRAIRARLRARHRR